MEKHCKKCGVVLEKRNWWKPKYKVKSGEERTSIQDYCRHCLFKNKACKMAFESEEIAEKVRKRSMTISSQICQRRRKKVGNPYKVCPKKRSKAVLAWISRNPEEARRRANISAIKQRENLTDNYVRSCLIGIENITPELIKLKRKHLLIKRKLKQHVKNSS